MAVGVGMVSTSAFFYPVPVERLSGWVGYTGISRRLRLEGLTFQLVEHALRPFWDKVGEEIVLVASKR